MGATICIGREMLCLPYAGFFFNWLKRSKKNLEQYLLSTLSENCYRILFWTLRSAQTRKDMKYANKRTCVFSGLCTSRGPGSNAKVVFSYCSNKKIEVFWLVFKNLKMDFPLYFSKVIWVWKGDFFCIFFFKAKHLGICPSFGVTVSKT